MIKLLFVLLAFSVYSWAENIRVAVWHTNDVHGWMMPREASFNTADPKRMVGGASVLARVLEKEKEPKLVLDAGDWYQGTPEGTLTKGKAMVEIYNALHYDAMAPGNHEFDYGVDNVKSLIKGLKAPVLGCNTYDLKTGKRVDFLKPWMIKEVAGVKIGIFGLLTTKMPRLVLPKQYQGLEFRREVDEAKKAVRALKKEGATVIIALSHAGFETPDREPFEGDQTIAASVPGIDLVVGGHSHTFLREAVRDATYGTLIVQAGANMSIAGRTLLEIDQNTKKVVKSEDKLIDLWVDEHGQDPAIAAIVDRYVKEVGQVLEVVVATAATAIPHSRTMTESPMGDWMMDCARDWTKTDVAFQNPGGIRSGISAGPVTLRHIFNIMPFENTMVNMTMTGSQVRDILERGASGKGSMQLSGMRVVFDPSLPKGGRLVSASVNDRELRPDGAYTVTAVDFLVDGGDGYDTFRSVKKKEYTYKLLRDILEWCARKQGTLSAPAPGRIWVKGG
ncbi:MAG: bifunctional metallophosphatase/5'-nucleotidase [Elusimicrobia bacterium]|nr:bifunctional metallophosphatase/5'-nucleotidase [Elusimicrobiota bacterium]